jgi:hypothetical protein
MVQSEYSSYSGDSWLHLWGFFFLEELRLQHNSIESPNHRTLPPFVLLPQGVHLRFEGTSTIQISYTIVLVTRGQWYARFRTKFRESK